MAKRLTVFYSWQSDSPSNLNRNFIEKAIREALKRLRSDATLENALRDTIVEIDKDTQGVSGSPPIAETILRKIEGCSVFIADLSYVGESKRGYANSSGNPRQFPNPNVLIEYGYALRCHTHAKLVSVMNTAYGEPNAESLPFDLRHLRWPIPYFLNNSSAADKSNQFERLVATLVEAVGLILSHESLPTVDVKSFVTQKPTKNAAIFFEATADLITDGTDFVSIPEGAKAYLRICPSSVVPPIKSELDARGLAQTGNLQPMGIAGDVNYGRNIFGAIAHESPKSGAIFLFTQLFLSGEIWGVDARCLNADVISAWGMNKKPYIANVYIENSFVKALHNYLIFAQTHLKMPLPLQIKAGLVGIKGYQISINEHQIVGAAIRDSIEWQDEVLAYGKPACVILAPLFDKIWENCGFRRTAEDQAKLDHRFGG
jgi:hypothetical protein